MVSCILFKNNCTLRVDCLIQTNHQTCRGGSWVRFPSWHIPRFFFFFSCLSICRAGVHVVSRFQQSYNKTGKMRTPVREAFSYGIRHGIRHIHCDSMKHKVILHWITMNMPYPVPYSVWKCPPYGSTILPNNLTITSLFRFKDT